MPRSNCRKTRPELIQRHAFLPELRHGNSGSCHHFEEVWIDAGDVDMHRSITTYLAIGFEGPFMMDYTPHIPRDREGREENALATRFMRAMIQAVYGR